MAVVSNILSWIIIGCLLGSVAMLVFVALYCFVVSVYIDIIEIYDNIKTFLLKIYRFFS